MKGNGRTTCLGCGKRIPLTSARDTGYCNDCWWEKCVRLLGKKGDENEDKKC